MDRVSHQEILLCYLPTAQGDKVDNLLGRIGKGWLIDITMNKQHDTYKAGRLDCSKIFCAIH